MTTDVYKRQVLRLPLKRGKGLRHKGGRAQRDRHTASLRLIGIGIKGIDHLLAQFRNPRHVVHGFGRQSDHKVELEDVYKRQPVRKNSVSTLFALEAQINLWTGSPIFFA